LTKNEVAINLYAGKGEKMILDEILAHKRKEVARRKEVLPLEAVKLRLGEAPALGDFKEAISRPGKINLIAEIKKVSPSAGLIKADFEPAKIARIYAAAGASAISVLTDEKFFQGILAHLKEAKAAATLPILAKDFFIDEYQIYEARTFGADAFLVIARALSQDEIKNFLKIGESLGMAALVEVHDEEELTKAVGSGAEIIGINNRDLATFKVNLKITLRLAPFIPEEKILVSESGIKSREDVELLKEAGVNAVLIGEALLKEAEIKKAIKKIMG